MYINFEKAEAAYKGGFFAGAGQTANTLNTVNDGQAAACIFEAGQAEKTDFGGYDRTSKLLSDEESRIELPQKNENVIEFLNNAIDVLKNIVTDEDYSRLAELGITADKEDAGTLVTVYERIQIQLAAYGEANVTSLNLSHEKINEVIHSKALAGCVEKAERIGDISDEAKEYLLKNNEEPTVDNIYRAVHSADGKRAQAKESAMTEEEWRELAPQTKKFLEKNGMEADEKSMAGARWLLSREVPLTPDNLIKLEKLNDIEKAADRDMDEIKANMMTAMMFGAAPGDGYMTGGRMETSDVQDVMGTVEEAREETAIYLADNGYVLNVANLKKYENIYKDNLIKNKENENISDTYTRDGSEKRRKAYVDSLYQAKALLTGAGVMTMAKLGISVSYMELGEMTETCVEIEAEYAEIFFDEPSAEKTGTLTDVMNVMRQMKGIPVASIGAAAVSGAEFTVGNVYREGKRMEAEYRRAGETYEAVGTKVRVDLGDSIRKAFKNIDSLIEEAGLKPDDVYRRAVRVLGYNSMEVSKENIILMAEKTTETDRAIKNITPKTAAYLIENSINPLEYPIEELNDMLEEINEKIGAEADGEYSRYLWKLSKSGKISEEGKRAYIELYRAIKTVQRADARAVGVVVESSAAFTLENLLSAEKSRGKYNMNVAVDENTGFYQGRLVKSRLAELLSQINGTEGIENAENILTENAEKFFEMYSDDDSRRYAEEMNVRYRQEMAADMRETLSLSTESMLYSLLDSGMKVSAENIAAYSDLINRGRKIREDLKNDEDIWDRVTASMSGETPEQVLDVYESLESRSEKMYMENKDSGTESVEWFKRLYNSARFMAEAAGNKSYHIPTDIDGEDVLVHVKFMENKGGDSSIKVTVYSGDNETVEAEIKVFPEKVSADISCRDKKLEAFYRERAMQWQEDTENVRGYDNDNAEEKEYTDRQMYEIAVSFLRALKNWGRLPINNID